MFWVSITNLNLSTGQSDYCLIDSSVLSVLKQLPEKKNFLRGIINSLGFETTSVQYDTEARKSGKSKFSKVEYIDLALNGILSYSSAPVSIFFCFIDLPEFTSIETKASVGFIIK